MKKKVKANNNLKNLLISLIITLVLEFLFYFLMASSDGICKASLNEPCGSTLELYFNLLPYSFVIIFVVVFLILYFIEYFKNRK